jgi:hypothetical protein
MNKNIPRPKDVIKLQDLEELKIIADPLRNQIMEVLTYAPMTIKAVAGKLGVESSKLYYHFNQLDKHGFIHVVETTVQGNLIEKHYWITAHRFELEEELFNFNVDTLEGTENILTMLLTNINATRDDLRRSIYARHQQITQGAEKNPRQVLDMREIFNLPDEKAKEFHKRLHDLVKEFGLEAKEINSDKEVIPWALSVVFYPSFYYEEKGEQDD